MDTAAIPTPPPTQLGESVMVAVSTLPPPCQAAPHRPGLTPTPEQPEGLSCERLIRSQKES